MSLIQSLTAIAFLSFTHPARSQNSNSDALRKLLKTTPDLTMSATDLKTPGVVFVGISSVAADKQGDLYVIHRPESDDPIVELDRSGKFIRSWGRGLFHIPHTIRIDTAGNVWAIDANASIIYKFTAEGKRLLDIHVGDISNVSAAFCGATDIAFAASGHLFVTDGYCNARIVEYDEAGKKLNEWGAHGFGPGEFKLIHSIMIGPQGNLYVADRENGRIQWFDQKGHFLGKWEYGGQLHSLAFTKSGELYAVLHPKDAPPEKESYLVKINPATGQLLGKYPVRSHELGVAPDGTLLPATRSDQLLLLKPKP